MRTNIDIDDRLMRQAMRSSRSRTKRAAVEEGLRLLIQTRAQATIRRLRGKVHWSGDLHKSRGARHGEYSCIVIVDTTVWIDYLRGLRNKETEYFDREVGRQRFGLTDLILCETLQGVGDENTFTRVLRELRKFEVFETGSQELAIEAARNFGNLRRRGRTVRKTIDCLIATFCLRHGHSLLHRDRDYDHFEDFLGLTVIHP